MAVIDATDAILGRLCSIIAKRALKGEKIDVVNSEKAVVSGNRGPTIAYYKQKQSRGHTFHGPFFPKQPDRIIRRTVRGMLPYRSAHGADALKRVMCYNGLPEAFAKEKIETIAYAAVSKLKYRKYIPMSDIAKQIGGKPQ